MDEQQKMRELSQRLDILFQDTFVELEHMTRRAELLHESIQQQIEILKKEQEKIEGVLNA